MSGSQGTPFTDEEKTDIRRFCGYSVYGNSASAFDGTRFYQAFGLLEYRMNNLAPAEQAVVRTTYLANLYVLESALPTTAANLDTASAGPWVHNASELKDRDWLLMAWQRRLCGFLGIPPGRALSSPGRCVV